MKSKRAVTSAVALTAFVFGLLVWVYVVVVQLVYPDWISAPLSHVSIFPLNWRLDDVGMIAFAVAAAGFLLWRIEVNRESS